MSKNYITIDNVSALLEDEEASLIYPLMDEKFINDNKLEYDDFVASENKSIFEKIFTTYMKIENGRLYDKLMEMMISHGVWDVSKKDKFKRNSIDYMNTITKDYGQEKFMGFYIKYLSAMNETGSENLIDAKGFVNSLLDIESIKPILFISAWTHIFKFYDSNTKLIENKIFSQSLKEIDFSYKMSEILKDKLSHAFFGFSPLLKIYELPYHLEDSFEIFKTKNIKETYDNLVFCSDKVNRNQLIPFYILCANEKNIKNKSDYISSFIKLINGVRDESSYRITSETSYKVYLDLTKFYSYEFLLNDHYLKEELKFFVEHNTSVHKNFIEEDYKTNYSQFEKAKINSNILSSDSDIKFSKKRI